MGWLFFTVPGSVPLVSNSLDLVPLAVAGSLAIPITSVSLAWCLSRERKSPKVPVSMMSSRPGTRCPRCCSTWSTSCTALKESPPQVRNSSAGDSASSSCPVAPWKARNKLLLKKKAWQEHRRTQIIHCRFIQPYYVSMTAYKRSIHDGHNLPNRNTHLPPFAWTKLHRHTPATACQTKLLQTGLNTCHNLQDWNFTEKEYTPAIIYATQISQRKNTHLP